MDKVQKVGAFIERLPVCSIFSALGREFIGCSWRVQNQLITAVHLVPPVRALPLRNRRESHLLQHPYSRVYNALMTRLRLPNPTVDLLPHVPALLLADATPIVLAPPVVFHFRMQHWIPTP